MRFTKIKYNGVKVELTWIEKQGATGEVEHKLSSFDRPHPELLDALAAFIPIVLDLFGLGHIGWERDLAVTGLSINEEEDGRRGLVVTLQKKLADANAPLVLNTPHLREVMKDEEADRAGFMTDEMVDALTDAVDAAKGYVRGKRAQGELLGSEQPESAADLATEPAGASA